MTKLLILKNWKKHTKMNNFHGKKNFGIREDIFTINVCEKSGTNIVVSFRKRGS